jgi:hypothetical protein
MSFATAVVTIRVLEEPPVGFVDASVVVVEELQPDMPIMEKTNAAEKYFKQNMSKVPGNSPALPHDSILRSFLFGITLTGRFC